MEIKAALFIIVAYFIGSIPIAYIAGKLYRGIDIREYGSGTVGGANVWVSLSRRLSIIVSIADGCKGLLVIFLSWALGLELVYQVAGGLAVIAGHNWSAFLRFSGGRGVITAVAILLLLAPRELAIGLVPVVLGALFRQLPVGMIVAVASLPLVSWGLGEPLALTLGCLGILLLIVAKRLIANYSLLGAEGDWKHVLFYRLVFDRDTRDRKAWISRPPGNKADSKNSKEK